MLTFSLCLAAYSHHLSPRIAIAFSTLSGVPDFSMSHSSIFIISTNTSRSSMYNSHSPTMCVLLYCRLHCHKGISVHLRPAPPDYWYTSFFCLAGPGPLHKNATSA